MKKMLKAMLGSTRVLIQINWAYYKSPFLVYNDDADPVFGYMHKRFQMVSEHILFKDKIT